MSREDKDAAFVAELVDREGLRHYGVKGMRWGVRKAESEERADREGGTDDNKGSKKASSGPSDKKGKKTKATKVEQKKPAKELSRAEKNYVDRMQSRADQLKRISEGKGTKLDMLDRPLLTKKQIGKQAKQLQEHLDRVKRGEATLKDKINMRSQMTSLDYALKPSERAEKRAKHEDVDEFLEHYGIKGMRWGVRRSDEQLARAREGGDKVKVKKVKGKKVVVIEGGKNQSPSDDAVRTAVSKTKAKKSTTDSLSNAELKQLVERMNLEQQYSNLTSKQAETTKTKKFVKAGSKFASDVILQVAKQQASAVLNQKASAALQAKGILEDKSKK